MIIKSCITAIPCHYLSSLVYQCSAYCLRRMHCREPSFGQHRAIPVHETMDAAKALKDLRPRTKQ